MIAYNDNPTVSDQVYFDFLTTLNDEPIDPYKVNSVTIYYIERGYSVENLYPYEEEINSTYTATTYFKDAIVTETFGNDTTPAWLSTDTDNALITQLTEDENNDPLTGTFRLIWQPEFAREGDYILCYKWTPIVSGTVLSNVIHFYLHADTRQNTSSPHHVTATNKYELLLQKYTPEMFSLYLSNLDLTPDVLNRFNQVIAKGFTGIENLTNQILDLIDANAVPETLLPYIGNFFGLNLYSNDTILWRKQIKRAIPLFKKKGTLEGLTEALGNADIVLKKLTRLWQIISTSTWQEAFTFSDTYTWTLEKLAILPVDLDNYELFLNDEESDINNVSFANISGETQMTWLDTLEENDVVRIIYKFAEPSDQDLEDYIRTLPLADQRESPEFPKKNWNVRLIAEDDSLFDVLIPEKHPFHEPIVFGRIRTEFPYGENLYNSEEYNGSLRDSVDPCDIDKNFIDSCSYCQSSKFNIDVEVEDLSAHRMEETEEIIKNLVPFHAVIQNINYTASKTEFFPTPQEEIEILLKYTINDDVILTNPSFNRLLEDQNDMGSELTRSSLTDITYSSNYIGTGVNSSVALFSPGVNFANLGISDNNILRILTSSNAGIYTVTNPTKNMVSIVESNLIDFPLTSSRFSFQLSNIVFEDVVSVYQIDDSRFYDDDIRFIDYGVAVGWKIIITTGIYAGSYDITAINVDNSVSIDTILNIEDGSLNYELRTNTNALRYTGTASGHVIASHTGRMEIDSDQINIQTGDIVIWDGSPGTRFEVLSTEIESGYNNIYLLNWIDGDVVGTASVMIERRLVDGGIGDGIFGHLCVRGMELTGTIPTIDDTVENNQFLENYAILINDNYYKIVEIDGSTMTISGNPVLEWGISGTSVTYAITQFSKIAVETQDGNVFEQIDRRATDSMQIYSYSASMAFSGNGFADSFGANESISINIEYRD